MKLWHKLPKRIAIKKIGKPWLYKLEAAAKLKPGDLISTCKGYNERIKTITPEWSNYGCSKGEYVSDFDVETESGSCCSVIHCCTFPLENKEQVIAYFKEWAKPENYKMYQETWAKHPDASRIAKALYDGVDGNDIFDEDGQPLRDYCRDYEREARFGK